MKLNEIVLKDLFSHAPAGENFRFVFLVENEALEDKILQAGYMAVGISDEPQKAVFLKIIEECQFSWMKDFCFIPSSKFGFLGEVKKQLEGLGYTVLSDGWKIFKDKESRFLLNPEELKAALQAYIMRTSEPTSENTGQPPLAISAVELMKKEILPPDWIVKDMFLPGLSLLAGASKLGKSWFVLQLCICVASGKPFMGKETKKSKVLYLSLEDSERRLQSRMKRQLQGAPAPEGLFFVTKANQLGSGLIEQLEPYVKDGVKLIVIDTLQKVRVSGGNKNAYAADYDEMGVLKEYADKKDISIFPVHHTRKMKDDDVFNMVSGTTGIMGAADTIMILTKDKRSETKAALHVTGRDVFTDTLEVEFNRSTCTWSNLGSKEDLEKQEKERAYLDDPIVKTIKELLEDYSGWQGTATDFQNEMMNRNKGYIETKVIGKRFREVKQFLYEKDSIIYEEPDNAKRKIHKFRRTRLKLFSTDTNDTVDTHATTPP